MRILHHFAAVLACHEAGNQVHRAGSIQRVEGNQILQACGLGVFQHALHATAFKLEHRLGFAFGEQPVDPRIVERQVLIGKIFLPRMAFNDEFARQLQNGQGCQAQKVELDEANRFNVIFIKLTHRRVTARLLVKWTKVG